MYGRYRVIVVTPAGRARYLRVLAPHVLGAEAVDAWHLWRNTADAEDLACLEELARAHGKVQVIPPPVHPVPNGTATIGQYFRTTTDADAIYVRMDDDVVWLEPGFFDKLLAQRLLERDAFLVFPLIINNAVCTFLLQNLGLLDVPHRLTPHCLDKTAWGSGEFAEALHRDFLARVHAGTYDNLHFAPNVVASLARVSINCMAWFGVSMQPFDGVFPDGVDEEEWVSVTLPMLLRRSNMITGQAIAVHFAFFTQRGHLDRTDVLARYAELAPRSWARDTQGSG